MTRDWIMEAAGASGSATNADIELRLGGSSTSKAWAIVGEALGVSQPELAERIAGRFGLAVADLQQYQKRALELVPEELARRYDVFPLREERGRLVVATCDPTDLGTEQSLAFATGLDPEYEIAPPVAIRLAIRTAYTSRETRDVAPEAHESSTRSGDPHRVDPAPLFEDLGLQAPELGRFRELLSYRSGIVFVTGPAGSGKTTTLYAGLRDIATVDVNVMTVEDAVERELPGIRQFQLEPEADFTFASALRAALRHDPDAIFVGEIADHERARIAVEASGEGRLVLANLDTATAIGVIPRLAGLGLDLRAIETSLRGALAQRLIRKACEGCRRKFERREMTPEERELVERYDCVPPIRPTGCHRCRETGYSGRLPVAEVFFMDYRLSDLFARGASVPELERAATAVGMRTMLQSALDRVRAGETTLQEVARVLAGQRPAEPEPLSR